MCSYFISNFFLNNVLLSLTLKLVFSSIICVKSITCLTSCVIFRPKSLVRLSEALAASDYLCFIYSGPRVWWGWARPYTSLRLTVLYSGPRVWWGWARSICSEGLPTRLPEDGWGGGGQGTQWQAAQLIQVLCEYSYAYYYWTYVMAEVGNGHAYAYYSIFGTQRWAHFVRQTNFKTLFSIFMIFNILVKAVKWSNKKSVLRVFVFAIKKKTIFSLWFSWKIPQLLLYRLLEFKSIGIFAISFFVTEIWHLFDFQFFITVYVYFMNKHCKFFTVHS